MTDLAKKRTIKYVKKHVIRMCTDVKVSAIIYCGGGSRLAGDRPYKLHEARQSNCFAIEI